MAEEAAPAVGAAAAPPGAVHESARDGDLRGRALALHRRLLVADLHSHALIGACYLGLRIDGLRRRLAPWNPVRNVLDLVDLPRAEEGGLGLLVFVAYVLPALRGDYWRRTERQLDRLEALLAESPGRCALARDAAEARRIRASGRIAVMVAVEGGHSLEGRLENLERLRRRGCAYLTLTHFTNNALSGSSADPRERGLTPLGREAIREMERLGILVDLSHCSARARREAALVARAPLICSHTGLRRFVARERMTSDDDIRLVAASGGLVGILLSPFYLKGHLRAGVPDIVDNVEHVIAVAGEDHVAIGSDFDSGLPPPRGLRDIRDYPEITVEMLRRGFGEATIAKVWAGNFERVLGAVGR